MKSSKKSLKWPFKSIDKWQKDLIGITNNFILLCGRQVGKSEIVSFIEAEYLLNTPNAHLLIVSGVERQASGMYKKILRWIESQHPDELAEGRDKPLNTVFKLKNGAICRTEPLGLDGAGARQHTITRIVFEEMQLIPEEAFAAITPMLLTTGGQIHMLGTAWNTEGYVYERLSDPDFHVVRVNAEEIAEERPEPQKSIMKAFLAKEKERLPEALYAQEYLAIPSDKARQVFPDKLIQRCMVLERQNPRLDNRHVLGCDPAGLGEDEGAITILDTEDKENCKMIELIITEKLMTTQTTDLIIQLEKRYDFGKIYVDDGGVGFGVFSELLAADETKNKTIALNNSSRSLKYDDTERTAILKEDLYINLLKLMERGHIKLLKDPELFASLKSCKFEYNEKTKKLMINSTYNHPTESLTRAAWDAEGKDLKLSVHSIRV